MIVRHVSWLAALLMLVSVSWVRAQSFRPVLPSAEDDEPIILVQNDRALREFKREPPKGAGPRHRTPSNNQSSSPMGTSVTPVPNSGPLRPEDMSKSVPRSLSDDDNPGTNNNGTNPSAEPRDPTRPGSSEMDNVIRGNQAPMIPGSNSTPQSAPLPALPAIAVKARILSSNRPAVVVLEIDKQMYIVREKTALRIGKGAALTMEIDAIDQNGVRVFIPELNQRLNIN